jgi:Polysaccharide lyase
VQATVKAFIALSAFVLGLALAASASASVKIVAPDTVQAPAPARFLAQPSHATEQVAFYVDGRRRWVDRSPGYRFGRAGKVSLSPGRHVLKVRAVQPGGVVTTTRTIEVEPPAEPVALREEEIEEGAPASIAAPAPAPAPETDPAPAPDPTPAPPPSPADAPIVDAGFENGLLNWNIAGVGEVVPSIVGGDTRSGAKAARVLLTGNQNRSELSLGGTGTYDDDEMLHFGEGAEYWYGFSLNVKSMVYGRPGAHNLIMQFKSDGQGSPNFGLQLWDYEGDDGESGGKGLWSHSGAMGGDRFLSPLSERAWHDIAIHFKASNRGDGFYEVFLDGELIDARSGVSMIRPDRSFGYIKTGLYRNGETAPGTSELRVDSARLGTSATSVQPG